LPLLSLLSLVEFFSRSNSLSGERADNVFWVKVKSERDNDKNEICSLYWWLMGLIYNLKRQKYVGS
jgi:hypothetical protein